MQHVEANDARQLEWAGLRVKKTTNPRNNPEFRTHEPLVPAFPLCAGT